MASLLVANPAKVKAADGNLIANPLVQDIGASGLPISWQKNAWGTNSADFSIKTDLATGEKNLYVQMNSYTSGDAKWFFDPVTVEPNAQYSYSDYYKSSVDTEVVMQSTNINGQQNYYYLGSVPASSAWSKTGFTFTAPSNAVKITIFHLINKVGYLQTDTFSLTKYQSDVVLNGIPNGSVENTLSGATPQEWQKGNWGQNAPTFSYLNTGHTGSHSIKVALSNYSSGDAKWYYTPQPVTSGGNFEFKDYYQSNIPTVIVAMINKNDGTTIYQNLGTAAASTAWALFSVKFTIPTDAKTMSVMHIINKNGYLITDDYSLNTYVPKKFQRGLVTLTFDDAWSSYYTNALPIMSQYGYKSTAYVLTGSLGSGGYMNLSQVKDAYAQGNEIASHTVSHPHLNNLTLAKLTRELVNSKNYLQTNIGPIYNFAAPYGEANVKTVSEIKKYYRSNRSVNSGYNSPDNFDPYQIKVQNVLQTTTIDEVQDWINQAKQNNYWLVLVYHQVDNSGATYGTSIDNFKAQMSAIQNSGLAVETLNQALNEITPQL